MASILASAALGMVKFFVGLYSILSFPIYAIFFRSNVPGDKSTSVLARIVQRREHDVTLRSTATSCGRREEILREKIDTLAKLFAFMVAKYGDRRALGTRRVIAEEREIQAGTGKEMVKLDLADDYSWRSYADVAEEAACFGRGLRELGGGIEKGDKVCIFSDTRAEWLISAIGCFQNGIALCTIYANLGEDGIVHGITQTNVSVVITSVELLPKIVSLKSQLSQVRTIIYFENPTRPPPDTVEGISLLPYSQVISVGRSSLFLSPNPPSPDDTAIIMYTSGSTGVPKGVILSHKNMISGILAILNSASEAFEKDRRAGPEDAYVAFLPLAHVLEMLAEHVVLLMGVKIGYSSPNTLTDKSSMIKKGQKGDAALIRPTIMAAVPLVLDRIYKGIGATIAEKGAFSQLLVNYCFEYRAYWSLKGYGTPIMDRVIFGKMKAIVGGRLRLLLSGGAPLSEEAQSFIRTALTCVMLQGYGLTETCSTATIGDPDDLTTGQVGPPLLGTDLRIKDWEEGGYTVNDAVGPRGEIVVGGDNVSGGYFNLPSKTSEDFFSEDGVQFFCTGDIGQVLPNGSVRIVDRKKDLVKLQAGEYVSLGKVESNLKINPLVDNMCVYCDSHHTAPVALVVPDNARLVGLADSLGMMGKSREELCVDPVVTKAVLEALMKQAQTVRLEKFEVPRKVRLIPELWTPESGLVTAAFKLRRKPIQVQYQHLIDEMYQELLSDESRVTVLTGSKAQKTMKWKVAPA